MSKSPISFRPSPEERALLSAQESRSASDVLRQGLALVRAGQQSFAPKMPLFAKDVDEHEVRQKIEEAVDAACAVLDDMMRAVGTRAPDVNGISSNFQGLLTAHIRAMLTGKEHAGKEYATPLPTLMGTWQTYGLAPMAKTCQGFVLRRHAQRNMREDLFFNGNRGWVPFSKLDIGELYTSAEMAISATLEKMFADAESPAEFPMSLELIDFNEALVLVPRNSL